MVLSAHVALIIITLYSKAVIAPFEKGYVISHRADLPPSQFYKNPDYDPRSCDWTDDCCDIIYTPFFMLRWDRKAKTRSKEVRWSVESIGAVRDKYSATKCLFRCQHTQPDEKGRRRSKISRGPFEMICQPGFEVSVRLSPQYRHNQSGKIDKGYCEKPKKKRKITLRPHQKGCVETRTDADVAPWDGLEIYSSFDRQVSDDEEINALLYGFRVNLVDFNSIFTSSLGTEPGPAASMTYPKDLVPETTYRACAQANNAHTGLNIVIYQKKPRSKRQQPARAVKTTREDN